MRQAALDRIADELEQIRTILENYLPPVRIPSPPMKLLGADSISYVNEETMVELEEEEWRQIQRGLIPNSNDPVLEG